MPTRYSMIFALTTEASDRDSASPHSGGWTEGYWDETQTEFGAFMDTLAVARAAMLPKQAAIIGFRSARYSIQGNRLVPLGTASKKVLFPGRAALECDLPQVAIQLSVAGAGGNTSRSTLRGMPDDVMLKGEYTPTPAFKGAMTRFCNLLVSGTWGFVGRDLGKPVQKVITISDAGVAKLRGATGAAVGDYVRLLKVIGIDKKPIKGVFRVSASADAGLTLTLEGWPPGLSVKEKGGLRHDVAKYIDIIAADPSRACVRKIGGPFEKYRGRASKKAA